MPALCQNDISAINGPLALRSYAQIVHLDKPTDLTSYSIENLSRGSNVRGINQNYLFLHANFEENDPTNSLKKTTTSMEGASSAGDSLHPHLVAGAEANVSIKDFETSSSKPEDWGDYLAGSPEEVLLPVQMSTYASVPREDEKRDPRILEMDDLVDFTNCSEDWPPFCDLDHDQEEAQLYMWIDELFGRNSTPLEDHVASSELLMDLEKWNALPDEKMDINTVLENANISQKSIRLKREPGRKSTSGTTTRSRQPTRKAARISGKRIKMYKWSSKSNHDFRNRFNSEASSCTEAYTRLPPPIVAVDENFDAEPPEHLVDNVISFALINEAVITPNGNTYDRLVIERHIGTWKNCPVTKNPLQISDLRPNRALQLQIDEWKTQHRI